jgi:hypothetical protein
MDYLRDWITQSLICARRFEKFLNKPRYWLDESKIEDTYCEPLPQDMRDLLHLYVKLNDIDKTKLYEIGKILLGTGSDD